MVRLSVNVGVIRAPRQRVADWGGRGRRSSPVAPFEAALPVLLLCHVGVLVIGPIFLLLSLSVFVNFGKRGRRRRRGGGRRRAAAPASECLGGLDGFRSRR